MTEARPVDSSQDAAEADARDPRARHPAARPLTPVPAGWIGRPLAETRSILEATRLLLDPVAYGRGVPRGDGRPVLLVPGFLAGDESLIMLRRWLRHVGYAPQTAGFLMNIDCADRALERVERLAEAVHSTAGRRAAVIGHSRGGHLARALAARRPDLVSHAVSMGADLQGLFGISSPTRFAVGAVRRGLHLTKRSRAPDCFRKRCTCTFIRDYTAPFPTEHVRLVSIYSKGDGVVRWERAIVPEADCIEVQGSHVGLASNRSVYRVLGEVLARGELAAPGGS